MAVFTQAPGLDLAAACHLAADPSHHAFARAWVERAMLGAGEEVTRAARTLRVLPLAGLELTDLFLEVWNCPPAEALDRVAAASDTAVQKALLDRVVEPRELAEAGPQAVADRVAGEAPWVLSGDREALRLAVADPGSLARAIVTVGRHLAPAVTARVAELAKPYAAFSASLRVEYEQRASGGPLDFAQERMGKKFGRVRPYEVFYFAPSWFLAPHKLRVWDDERCFILLGYPPRAPEAAERATELARLFALLADRNRLLLLQTLVAMPEYGRRLAPRLGLAPATVSHHLDALARAGLVEARTAGKIKYYSVNRPKVDQALRLFGDFLDNR